MTRRTSLLFVALALGLTGCHRATETVSITTYLSPDLDFPAPSPTNGIAVLAVSEPDEPLLEREVATKVESLLRDQGYAIQPAGTAAHVLVAYFTIDAGRTAMRSYDVFVPGGTAYTRIRTDSGRTATARTRLPGTFEQETYEYTYFTRYLGASLYDHERYIAAAEGQAQDALVWRSNAHSFGDSDLRAAVDFLLIATLNYFGKDSKRQVEERYDLDDERVATLRTVERR